MILHDGTKYRLEKAEDGSFILTDKHNTRSATIPTRLVREALDFDEDGHINTDGMMFPVPWIDWLLAEFADYLAPNVPEDDVFFASLTHHTTTGDAR